MADSLTSEAGRRRMTDAGGDGRGHIVRFSGAVVCEHRQTAATDRAHRHFVGRDSNQGLSRHLRASLQPQIHAAVYLDRDGRLVECSNSECAHTSHTSQTNDSIRRTNRTALRGCMTGVSVRTRLCNPAEQSTRHKSFSKSSLHPEVSTGGSIQVGFQSCHWCENLIFRAKW